MGSDQTHLYLFLEQIVDSQLCTSSLKHWHHYFFKDCLHVTNLWQTRFSCDLYRDQFYVWHHCLLAMHCFCDSLMMILLYFWAEIFEQDFLSDNWLLPSIDFVSCLPWTSALALLLAISCWIFSISTYFSASFLCSARCLCHEFCCSCLLFKFP